MTQPVNDQGTYITIDGIRKEYIGVAIVVLAACVLPEDVKIRLWATDIVKGVFNMLSGNQSISCSHKKAGWR